MSDAGFDVDEKIKESYGNNIRGCILRSEYIPSSEILREEEKQKQKDLKLRNEKTAKENKKKREKEKREKEKREKEKREKEKREKKKREKEKREKKKREKEKREKEKREKKKREKKGKNERIQEDVPRANELEIIEDIETVEKNVGRLREIGEMRTEEEIRKYYCISKADLERSKQSNEKAKSRRKKRG